MQNCISPFFTVLSILVMLRKPYICAVGTNIRFTVGSPCLGVITIAILVIPSRLLLLFFFLKQPLYFLYQLFKHLYKQLLSFSRPFPPLFYHQAAPLSIPLTFSLFLSDQMPQLLILVFNFIILIFNLIIFAKLIKLNLAKDGFLKIPIAT